MKRAIVVGIFALACLTRPAAADSVVAIVEEVQGKVTGAESMDYVTPRTVIKLGQNASVVISYMNSCRRESIAGIGTVIIGTEESIVHLADVKGEKVECDASRSHATTRETGEVAATVLRSVGKNSSAAKSDSSAIKTELTLYGSSPLVEAKGRGTLRIERLDAAGERHQIELNGNQLKGKFYDFASANRSLTPGGTYRASFGASNVLFRIAESAKSGRTPVVGRLLRME